MEFYHLRSFVAVAQTGNLTKAATRLYSTPPAISAHIKALEKELATQLFIRSSRGMALTAKGEILLEQAKQTLSSAQHMVNMASDNSAELIGHCNLALNADAVLLRVAELAEGIAENCPGIQISFDHMATGRIIEKLASGELDAGYIYGDICDDYFKLTIASQRVTTIAPNTFDTSMVQSIADLEKQTWISVGKYCPFDLALKKRLSSINASFVSHEEASRASLVAKGLGLSLIEEQIAEELVKTQQAKRIKLLDFDMPLLFVVKKQQMNDPIIQAVLQEVRILWQIPFLSTNEE